MELGGPRCARPDVVRPVRIDPRGKSGPTRQQARSKQWRRSAHGWLVPATVDSSVVEQRIIEQAVRLPTTGAVTGWASLRWQGAAFFDGTADGGRTLLPVPLLPGRVGNLRPSERCLIVREGLPPYDRIKVAAIGCTTPCRAVFDEVRMRGHLRDGVVAADMACAAGLLTADELVAYVATRQAWTGVPLARLVVVLVSDHSRSPMETRLRLVWVIDAGLPPPLCNRAVFDLQGRLLGYPDLLDEQAGMVAEFDGAHHRTAQQHRADVVREALFRDHGLEYAAFVGADVHDHALAADRLHRTRARARFLPPDQRAWTLDPPPGWTGRLYL
jgi:hypothetical protein